MNRISRVFQNLHSQSKKAIVPYITPEFPIRGTSVPLILALESAGASMIEIGVPFSDPLADGPTIQHSSDIAIKNGVNVSKVFELVKEARTKTEIPLMLMGYVNPILNYGMEKFLSDAKSVGVDGMIIPDLLPEESEEYRALSKKYGISTVFLIAPTSSDERIRVIDDLSTDFTYCVSVTGVTGARSSFGSGIDQFLSRVKKNTKKPFVVGFGIKNKEQATEMCRHSSGVVVGSALLQEIAEKKNVDDVVAAAKKFISSLV
ncbi:MAG: tryptophan synthase subunit alpha [Bacteroidota bacterium]